MKTLVNYFKEVWVELKNVKWPTRKDTINITLLIIAFSVVIGYLLGGFDIAFVKLIKNLIS